MTKQVPFTPASEPSAGSQDSARKARDVSDSLYKVILVPFDFSEHSNRTLEYATRIAARENAKIRLLHVFRIPDYAVTQYGRRPHDCDELRWQAESAEQEAQENLNAVEKEVLSRGIKAEAYFRVGYPLEEIVLMANDPEVDLVIIGSHGCSAIKRLLLGSTAERVVEHARCPVLVVKERSPSA
jgi:nucleotide-binding universal stress UspA family protein